MKISPVTRHNAAEYIRYCRRYGAEHDESYLPDDAFVPTEEFPAYLLSVGNVAAGAAGLMRTRPYREKRKARLTIFHTVDPSPAAYAALLAAIRRHTGGLDGIYGFLPEARMEVRRCWEALGFAVERQVYQLAYLSREVPPARIPGGFRLTALAKNDDAQIRELCDVWNRNYGRQPGFIGATTEYIAGSFDGNEHVPGGTLLLRHGVQPVGTVHVSRDDSGQKSADISMLSVIPDHRGRGLGRLMLRKAIAVALRNDLHPVYLSVNTRNDSAVRLYLSEGFAEESVMVCYRLAFA
jgi:mycothiol synthase